MNPDCWIHVFSFLPIREKMVCESVSRSFQQMIQCSLSRQENICTRSKRGQHQQQYQKPVSSQDLIPSPLISDESYRHSLQSLLSKCPNLRSLTVTSRSPTPPDEIILMICRYCPKLEILHIHCPNIRITWAGAVFEQQMSHAWKAMMIRLPRLTSLSLPFCSSERLAALLEMRRMREIDVTIYNEPVTSDHLMHASIQLASLSGCILMHESGIRALIHRCPKLQTLNTGPLTNPLLHMIGHEMVNLSSLSFTLVRSFVIDQMIDFSLLKNLQHLSITSYNFKHFDGGLLKIARQTGRKMRSISLEGFLITDLSLSFVSTSCPDLDHLKIRRSIFLPVLETPGITDDSVKSFAKFTGIQSIDIDSPNCLTHAGISFLLDHAASKQIRFLRVWDATRGTVSTAVLQAANEYCVKNTIHGGKEDILTICLDHHHPDPVERCHGSEDQGQGGQTLSQEALRQKFDSSPDGVRLSLARFNPTRDRNLHLKIRIGSQCLVYK